MGFKSASFAKDLELDPSNFYKYEKGKDLVTENYVVKMVDKYHLNPAWLYFGEGSMIKNDTNSAREQSSLNVKNTQVLSALSLIRQAAVRLEGVLSEQEFSEEDMKAVQVDLFQSFALDKQV